MKFLLFLSVLLSLGVAIQTAVWTGDDYVLTAAQKNFLFNGIGKNPIHLWSNGQVYYKYSNSVSEKQRKQFREALNHIRDKSDTCLRFFQVTPSSPPESRNHILVTTKDDGCYSYVGRIGGQQVLNLNPKYGCWNDNVIIHEVLHALGMLHQHQNLNRDKYVKVIKANILNQMRFAFKKYKNTVATNFNVGYDFDSIMHLPNKAFSKNSKPTLERLNRPNYVLGSTVGMSRYDSYRLKNMYNCYR